VVVTRDLSPVDIVRSLADGDRLRVVAALALGAGDIDQVMAATALDHRDVTVAISRLVAVGLIERDEHGLRVAEELIRTAARAAASPVDPLPDHPLVDASVLRAFIADGRLVAIPTSRRKLVQVLDLLAQDFELGRRYSERQVNDQLRRWHPDVATLRRHLVDFGFLDRQGGGGSYWRSGGSTMP
jgi:hypothetical protein